MAAPIPFSVPAEVAFDYLAEPSNRPQWQSSLKRVRLLDDGPPRVGTRWIDETVVGMRPEMQLTELDRPRRWAETGTWRGFSAWLALDFTPTGGGCEVRASMRVTGAGPLRLVGVPATLAGSRAVRADLQRAARILGSGQ